MPCALCLEGLRSSEFLVPHFAVSLVTSTFCVLLCCWSSKYGDETTNTLSPASTKSNRTAVVPADCVKLFSTFPLESSFARNGRSSSSPSTRHPPSGEDVILK